MKRFFLWFLLTVLLICGCSSASKKSSAPVLPAAADLKAGDIFTFGRYEQDNDPDNGAEPIEWQVLTVEDGRALLISRYALDARPYNKAYINITWRRSTLRKWLNGDFFSSAFSSAEKNSIAEVKISNPDNVYSRAWGGSPTKDRIFLLNIYEMNTYFSNDAERQCEATAYAKAKGAYIDDDGNSWWWLRSPGRDGQTAAVALSIGYYTGVGYPVTNTSTTVRPAFWLYM